MPIFHFGGHEPPPIGYRRELSNSHCRASCFTARFTRAAKVTQALLNSKVLPEPPSIETDGSIRRRGRPTLAETARISELIVVAARDIFLSHGFEHASIEAVAARAGVKKDTIYKRYPDKRALLWAVLQERIQAWRSGGNLEPRGEGLEESLKSYAVALLRHRASAEGRIWIGLVEAAWPGFELVETRRKALGYDRAVRLISREIQIRTAHDEHPAQNADFVAVTLMSMLSGWSDTAASGSDMTEQKVTLFAHAAVDIIMNGRNAW